MAKMAYGNKRTTAKMFRREFVILAMVSMTSGCTLRKRIAERKVKQLGWVDPAQHREMALTANPPYVIEPPDTLVIQIRPDQVGPLPLESIVGHDGQIDLGFAGRVYVAGLTLEMAESVVSQHVTEYVKKQGLKMTDPIEAHIRVDESKSKYYYVLGKGVTQSRIPITGRETVLDAVMAAQIKSNALLEKIYVVRPHPEGLPDQVLAVNWLAIRDRGETTTNYQLFPGDRLVIPGGPEPGLIETLFGSR